MAPPPFQLAAVLSQAWICATCGVPADPVVPISVIRAVTARPRADDELRGQATARPVVRDHALFLDGSEAAVEDPGAPGAGRRPRRRRGDRDVGGPVSAPAGTPDSDGSTIAAANPPGMRARCSGGRVEALVVTAVSLRWASRVPVPPRAAAACPWPQAAQAAPRGWQAAFARAARRGLPSACVISSTAATTWPTLVARAVQAPRLVHSRRDSARPCCAGRRMPVSAPPSRPGVGGDHHVRVGRLAPGLRTSGWMRARPCWPGPTENREVGAGALAPRRRDIARGDLLHFQPRAMDPLRPDDHPALGGHGLDRLAAGLGGCRRDASAPDPDRGDGQPPGIGHAVQRVGARGPAEAAHLRLSRPGRRGCGNERDGGGGRAGRAR